MKVVVQGKGTVNLDKRYFLDSGGEGDIYAHQGVVYKIYHEPSRCIPFAKMQELSLINDPNIIIPNNMLLNGRNKPIGYTMKHVKNTFSLCQFFPKSFRDRNQVTNEQIAKIVIQMRNMVQHIHSNKILIVDLNEMNCLVGDDFKTVYFIDTDSYQTPSFPATAIMETIRDRHSDTFSENTDWFAFGIVSFQLFIGIHPYKGKHASIKTLDDRMKANIPVFHKDVSFPKVCLPFDIIPQTFKDWYKAVFYDGKRLPPPTDIYDIITITPVKQEISGTDNFDITKILELDNDEYVIDFLSANGVRSILTNKAIYRDYKWATNQREKRAKICVTPQYNRLVRAWIIDDKLYLYDETSKQPIEFLAQAEKIMTYQGRLLVKNDDKILEIEFVELPNKTLAGVKVVTSVMPQATSFYEGVAIQNVLGNYVACVFDKPFNCYQINLEQLKGHKIISAKYCDNILMVVGQDFSGKYDKFIYCFPSNFQGCTTRVINDISYLGVNFAVLENGVVVHISDDEQIEIFSNKKGSSSLKVINDPVIGEDMKLYRDGVKVIFVKDNELFRIKVK